jgi:hemoglobin
MQKIRNGTVAFALIGALVTASFASAFVVSAQDGMAKKSLYERLGGEAAISAVIDDFVGRVAADPRINGKFARSNVERVKFHLKEQVCAVTGGPCKYTGKSMTSSHKNMGVTEGEFNALVEDLVLTLDKFNVPAAEKGELLTTLGSLKNEIVEVNSAATGTPLPAKFKPASPLSQSKLKKGPYGNAKAKKTGMK